MVSLSAATISEILRREPGLLLEVKRVLVRKAYEQGRLLDPADLTDEALFQLLREDDNVRILATQEIEKREYVRPKPRGRKSIKNRSKSYGRRRPCKAGVKRRSTGRNTSSRPAGSDDAAARFDSGRWVLKRRIRRARAIQCLPGATRRSAASRLSPRQSMAGLQSPERDSYEGAPPDPGSLPRISPESHAGLLSASMEESGVSGAKIGAMDAPSFSPTPLLLSLAFPRQFAGLALPLGDRFRTGDVDSPARHPDTAATAGPRRRPWDNSPPGEPVCRGAFPLRSQHPVLRLSPVLVRFGEDVFRNGTGNFDELPMDLPVGTDYVLGPGDALSIELWGGISQHLQRVVDREGRVTLPEAVRSR